MGSIGVVMYDYLTFFFPLFDVKRQHTFDFPLFEKCLVSNFCRSRLIDHILVLKISVFDLKIQSYRRILIPFGNALSTAQDPNNGAFQYHYI